MAAGSHRCNRSRVCFSSSADTPRSRTACLTASTVAFGVGRAFIISAYARSRLRSSSISRCRRLGSCRRLLALGGNLGWRLNAVGSITAGAGRRFTSRPQASTERRTCLCAGRMWPWGGSRGVAARSTIRSACFCLVLHCVVFAAGEPLVDSCDATTLGLSSLPRGDHSFDFLHCCLLHAESFPRAETHLLCGSGRSRRPRLCHQSFSPNVGIGGGPSVHERVPSGRAALRSDSILQPTGRIQFSAEGEPCGVTY
jgi:hypothetical protein